MWVRIHVCMPNSWTFEKINGMAMKMIYLAFGSMIGEKWLFFGNAERHDSLFLLCHLSASKYYSHNWALPSIKSSSQQRQWVTSWH